jgi:hypothetical protein
LLLPLTFSIVASRKARSSERIGVAFARRAASRSAGGLPLMSASIANSRAINSSACAAAGDFVSTWMS